MNRGHTPLITMNYLITGGTGLIGASVARQLVDRDDGDSIVCYDWAPDYDRVADIEDDVEVVQGDIREVEKLTKVFVDYDIDRVFHSAYLLSTDSQQNPLRAIDVNCVGTGNVFELSAIFDVDMLAMASSLSINLYFDREDVEYEAPNKVASYDPLTVDEEGPRDPKNVYSACKTFNEDIARHYATERGLEIAALRFGSVFGPGRKRGGSVFMSDLIENPVRGEPVEAPAKYLGADWTYVKDAARSTLLAFDNHPGGFEAYNIISEFAPIKKAADVVRENIPDANITLTEAFPETIPGVWGRADISKAAEVIEYEPAYPLEVGIADHIEILRAEQY